MTDLAQVMEASKQVAAALKELKQVGRREPRLAVEGCLRLLAGLKAKDSALDDVLSEIIDWLGSPMRRAKPTEPELTAWLERLSQAYLAQPTRLARLGAQFGALCGAPAVAGRWADRFYEELSSVVPTVPRAPLAKRAARRQSAELMKGAADTQAGARGSAERSSAGLTNSPAGSVASAPSSSAHQTAQTIARAEPLRLLYLSCLGAALRHEALLAALTPAHGSAPHADTWAECALGVTALGALGQVDAALRFAQQYATLTTPREVARTCEAALLRAGREEEAYREYALLAAEETRYVAWFRAVRQKYPERAPASVLDDLVTHTVRQHGEAIRGKWFAAAKDAALYDEAIALARCGDADTRTLLRAARDFAEREPGFALEAGLTALTAMLEAGPYEITKTDVWAAYNAILLAANAAHQRAEVLDQLRALLRPEAMRDRLVTRTLSRELNLA